jgi:60 kDa SS-A/Ro ribonucleoprotein
MANKKLFGAKKTDANNEAGGTAYALSPKQALAQYAATGCLNGTYYASAHEQLANVLRFCAEVDDVFIARTAIYCRERGLMKDMPALLCALLASRNVPLLEAIFPRVIDNGTMLRNFVQILRSGTAGRKSLGTAPKRMVRNWLEKTSAETLFRASVGRSPSLVDVIRMVHPKPESKEREALYGYLLRRPHDAGKLPALVSAYEKFKKRATDHVPDVPFQMLTSLQLDSAAWMEIARNAPWQMTRMNLNTFARHGVFANEEVTKMIAKRLADPRAIRKARVFPYQLLAAFRSATDDVPEIVRDALQEAMEHATVNVPEIEGQVYVCPDVSGSMSSTPVTGARGSASSAVRCIDVAALVAASILRRNRTARVLPFEERVIDLELNPRDSVMTNAEKLAAEGGGGTACSAPLARLNQLSAFGDVVIFVSDNESWSDPQHGHGTEMMKHWNRFRRRNPKARLVCIDLQPYATTQAEEREDVLNIGGFSDEVFTTIAEFAAGRLGSGHWTGIIDNISLTESEVA